jgi:predicted MFS family arabinose efflux permease
MAAAVGIGRFAFTPLLPPMIADGAVTLAGGGALAMANLLGYLAGAMSAPFVRMSPRALIVASLAGGVGATWAMALTDGLALWLVLRFAAGVAGAWVFVTLSSWLIARLDRDGRTGASGILFTGVGGGIVLGAAAGAWLLADDLGWRTGWRTMASIALAAMLLAIFLLPRDTESPEVVPSSYERLGGGGPGAAIVVVAYGVFGFGYIIPATFLPLMAQAHTDNPFAISAGWLLFGIAAMVITLAVGGLRHRLHPRTLWTFSQAAMAVGVILPAIWPTILAAAATGIIVGATCALTTMTGMWEAQRLRNGRAHRLVAAMTSVFAGGQILGPYAGVIAVETTGSFTAALGLAALALFGTAFALAFGPRDASPLAENGKDNHHAPL